MKQFLDTYWVIYFIGYLVALAVQLWMDWGSLAQGDNAGTRLAVMYGVAAGSASAFAILAEVGGIIVLLIPRRVRQLKQEGGKERDARYREAYRRFGVEVNGVVMLPDTPEVQEFLNSAPGATESE